MRWLVGYSYCNISTAVSRVAPLPPPLPRPPPQEPPPPPAQQAQALAARRVTAQCIPEASDGMDSRSVRNETG